MRLSHSAPKVIVAFATICLPIFAVFVVFEGYFIVVVVAVSVVG
jgi:hypothetical protein